MIKKIEVAVTGRRFNLFCVIMRLFSFLSSNVLNYFSYFCRYSAGDKACAEKPL